MAFPIGLATGKVYRPPSTGPSVRPGAPPKDWPKPAPGSGGFNPIYAPERTTLASAFEGIKGLLPEFKPIDYTPVAGVTNQLGDDYFDTIEKQASGKLQEKFFGAPDSLAKQQQNLMNKRGLIGSGIEVGGQNQLYKTFGDELVDLQSNIGQQKVKTAQDVEFKNLDVSLENAARKFEAEAKNREFEGFLSELGLRAASDEAESATDFDTKMFESEVELNKGEREQMNKLMDSLNTALENKFIDEPTRRKFRDIFEDKMIDYFGTPRRGSRRG